MRDDGLVCCPAFVWYVLGSVFTDVDAFETRIIRVTTGGMPLQTLPLLPVTELTVEMTVGLPTGTRELLLIVLMSLQSSMEILLAMVLAEELAAAAGTLDP